MLIYSSPRLIAVSHVLLRLLMPRHSPYALFRLNFLNRSSRSIMRCPSSQIIILRLCYSPYFALLAKFVVINYTITERPSDFCHTFSFQGIKKWSFLIICSFLIFSLYSVFNELFSRRCFRLVETIGIEPTTSWMPFKRSPRWATPPWWTLFPGLIPGHWTTNRFKPRRFGLLYQIRWSCSSDFRLTYRTLRTFSIERRWSSRTFRYGYLVTT